MNVSLLQLTLLNFKGIRDLTIHFEPLTTICGDNATGKTTINDAFTWLLFGKDSSDRKDFNIKTLDFFGNAIPQLDHQVTAVISVDGKEIELIRIYREKWQKKRGEEANELTGHETLYYYNGVPLQQKEYQAKISAIIDEQLFKLLTNCFCFNSLPWSDRRSVLTTLVPEVSDSEVAALSKDFLKILDHLSGKSLIEFKRELLARKTKLKNDLSFIPSRIDEISRSAPAAVDYDLVLSRLDEVNKKISEIDALLVNKSAAWDAQFEHMSGKQNELHALKLKVLEIKNTISRDHNEAISKESFQIQTLKNSLSAASAFIDNLQKDSSNLFESKSKLENRNAILRTEWNAVAECQLSFKEDHAFKCPTCNRTLDPYDMEEQKTELRTNFKKQQESDFARIEQEGISNKQSIQQLDEKLSALAAELLKQQNDFASQSEALAVLTSISEKPKESLESKLQNHPELISLEAKIKSFEFSLNQVPVLDLSELQNQKNDLLRQSDELKKTMNLKVVADNNTKRKSELLAEEKNLVTQLSELEKLEYQVANFTKAKTGLIEARINKLFRNVSFRMFDVQLNGAIVECCDTLINGVPFPDANNAAKINAGIDIINVLSAFHGVNAPVFIDNRESVNEIIPSASQLINLVVTKDKSLIVN